MSRTFTVIPQDTFDDLQVNAGEQLTASQWQDILHRTVAAMNARRQMLQAEKLFGILQNMIKH